VDAEEIAAHEDVIPRENDQIAAGRRYAAIARRCRSAWFLADHNHPRGLAFAERVRHGWFRSVVYDVDLDAGRH
jgi:hypothetical protein